MVVIVNCRNCLMVRIKYLLVSNDHILMTFFFFFFFLSPKICVLYLKFSFILCAIFSQKQNSNLLIKIVNLITFWFDFILCKMQSSIIIFSRHHRIMETYLL
jgi:hypothetical protein